MLFMRLQSVHRLSLVFVLAMLLKCCVNKHNPPLADKVSIKVKTSELLLQLLTLNKPVMLSFQHNMK